MSMMEYAQAKKRSSFPLKRTIGWIVLLALLCAVAFGVYVYIKFHQPLNAQGSEKLFEVPAGHSTKQIAATLEDERLVSSAFFFELYLYLQNKSHQVQAGSYALSSAMPISEIASRLTQGQAIQDVVRLTVIEGWDILDIAETLEAQEVMPAEEFVEASGVRNIPPRIDLQDEYDFLSNVPEAASLEGFLFPDTYFIARDADAETVIQKMLDNFDRKLDDEIRASIEQSGRSLYEVLIMASIVEREVGRNVEKGASLSAEAREALREERRIVAGIFYNRLAEGMRLESDATLAYVTGRNENRATFEDLEIDSPYNTYRNAGLPPTPIANPSLEAIRATLDPIETDYFYFLTSPDGTAHYARTFEEHQQNRARYLE